MPEPVFTLTPKVVRLLTEVTQFVGRFEGLQIPEPQLRLRRVNRARTIHGTTAIEGNTLTLERVTAVLEGKRVLAPPHEILEVKNARAAYDSAKRFRPWIERDLLSAHSLLMRGLASDAGRYRTRDVGVFKGHRVTHVAPPHRLVPRLVVELLNWGRRERDTHPIIKACVVHYELEFIHPFSDGNGRIGRLWQSVLLLGFNRVFGFLPAESLIHARQAAYYRALAESGRAGNCTPFVIFSLEALRTAMGDHLGAVRPERQTVDDRISMAREEFAGRWFSRRDYLLLHKKLSTATASRDLKAGVDSGAVRRRGTDRTTQYRFR